MISIAKNKKPLLALFLTILSASCTTWSIPERVKNLSSNTIKYGDYYLNLYAKGVKANEDPGSLVSYLTAGREAITEQVFMLNSYNRKEVPLMDKGTGDRVYKCYESLIRYQIAYLAFEMGVTTFYVASSSEAESELEKVNKQLSIERQEVLKMCMI